MTTETSNTNAKRRGISVDSWAVIVALLAALLIRVGIFKQIPW